MSGSDVIIVGGGVIGLTTAYNLARQGVRVALCDKGDVGMESSWAGAGILPPSHPERSQFPVDRLRALSGTLFPPLAAELYERIGINIGYQRCGGLEFTRWTEHHLGDEWFGLGATTRPLTAAQAITLESALAPDLGDVLEIPDMAQIRNPRFLQALRTACLASGNVVLHERTGAVDFVREGNSIKAIRLPSEELYGDRFVIAAGAWSAPLLAKVGCVLDIQPVRGQIALLNPGRRLFQRILIRGSQYLVPRADGRVLAGSTEEHAGFVKQTTVAGVQGLLELASKLVPALADAEVEKTWAGLRPGSPDDLPYIGVVPGTRNLYAAAGHFRAGLQLSTGTAEMLTQMLLNKPLTMPMDAFRLDRK
ncbi:MAG: FAD-dependent oxidoreductase [Gemmataceae bacterium]|nr:FAD-dependent oxidoreductase [Gemmataceae bacterium]